MTFEEFLDESQVGFSTIETKDDLESVIKRTWNAAIRASVKQLSDGYWYWTVDIGDVVKQEQYTQGEYCMLPEDELKKLLTS